MIKSKLNSRLSGIDEMTEADSDIIVKYFDSDDDGSLNFSDFLQIMLPCDDLKLRSYIEQAFQYEAPVIKYHKEELDVDVERQLLRLFEK